MIDLTDIKDIYVYCGYTDMRCGLNSLSVKISAKFTQEERKDALFLFCGKSRRTMKAVQFTEDGTWLYQKRMDFDPFRWPASAEESISLDRHQLERLLSGLTPITESKEGEIIY